MEGQLKLTEASSVRVPQQDFVTIPSHWYLLALMLRCT